MKEQQASSVPSGVMRQRSLSLCSCAVVSSALRWRGGERAASFDPGAAQWWHSQHLTPPCRVLPRMAYTHTSGLSAFAAAPALPARTCSRSRAGDGGARGHEQLAVGAFGFIHIAQTCGLQAASTLQQASRQRQQHCDSASSKSGTAVPTAVPLQATMFAPAPPPLAAAEPAA